MTKNTRVHLRLSPIRWSTNPLTRLGELREARDLIDDMTIAAIDECRPSTSWAKIAAELGVSRQSAWQRFGVKEES